MGYKLSEKTKNKISETIKNKKIDYSKISKKVRQLDKNTNEEICIFNSLSEAAKTMRHDNCITIMKVCKNKPHCKTAYGYKWEYVL